MGTGEEESEAGKAGRRGWRWYPEPVQLIFVLMFSICIVPRDKIYIDKVCELDMQDYLAERNLTTTVCAHMSKNSSLKIIEEETQRRVSELKVYEGLIMNVPSILFSLVAGNLADSRGRKLVIALPFIGNILSYAWLLIVVIFWETFPATYLLIAGVSGLTGGYMCLNIGLYSYIADTSSPTNRTLRMSILTGVFSLGYVIGVQIGGRVTNYVVIFVVALALSVLGLLYALFVLKESLVVSARRAGLIANLTAGFTAVLRRREGRTRLFILIFFFQFQAFMLCVNTGEYDYLMTRLKFSWQRTDFSNYLTAQRVARLVGLWVVLPLVSRFLKVADGIVVSVGCLVTTISYLILTVSTPSWGGDWPVYLSAVLQFNSVTTVAIRSSMSKLVEVDEVGRMFSLVGIGQAVIALVAHSLFGVIYRWSLDWYPTIYLLPVVGALFLSFLLSLIPPSSFRTQGDS